MQKLHQEANITHPKMTKVCLLLKFSCMRVGAFKMLNTCRYTCCEWWTVSVKSSTITTIAKSYRTQSVRLIRVVNELWLSTSCNVIVCSCVKRRDGFRHDLHQRTQPCSVLIQGRREFLRFFLKASFLKCIHSTQYDSIRSSRRFSNATTFSLTGCSRWTRSYVLLCSAPSTSSNQVCSFSCCHSSQLQVSCN